MFPTVSRLLSKRFKPSSKYLFLMNSHTLWINNVTSEGLTYCRNVQLYSTLKQSVVHDLCADINVSELKAKHKHEALSCSLADIVQSEVEQRLSNAIKQLNERELRFLKIVQLEHSFLFSEGYSIPVSMFKTELKYT